MGNILRASASYTVLTTDSYVGYSTLSAPVTVTLPSIASLPVGFEIEIKDESGLAGTHNITIDGAGSETIQGAANLVLSVNFGGVVLSPNGEEWLVRGSEVSGGGGGGAATSLVDSNGVSVVSVGTTASAVNGIEITNAATGNAPLVEAVGTDTNINLNLIGKGTGGVTVAGNLVTTTKLVTLNLPGATLLADQSFFTAERAYQVTSVVEIHATAGVDVGAVNMQVTKDTSTDAPGAGTDLLTNNTNAGFDLKGTANTVQVGTLTATTASLQLAAGDRLSVDFAGVLTTLAGVQLTVALQPI